MTAYLDHNATTALDPRVLEAMLPYLGGRCGNPSSVHRFGRLVRGAVDRARGQVAALVGAHPSQVLFTGGGTEANNLALKGAAARLEPAALAVSAVEHASLLGPARALERERWRLELLAVDGDGRVRIDALDAALRGGARLVSAMLANNETGTLQDLAALAGRVRAAGALLHSDAVQAAGKIAVDFAASGAHLMSLSAHKLYGPQGVGALIVDKAVALEPLLHGGGQERGLRGGTENVAGLVGFGKAAELAAAELNERAERALALRRELEEGLAGWPQVRLFAAAAERLPNTAMFGVAGIDGETLVMELDRRGFAVSSGSACSAGSTAPSHVLTAMGIEERWARGAVRVSLGRESTAAEVRGLLDALGEILRRLPGS